LLQFSVLSGVPPAPGLPQSAPTNPPAPGRPYQAHATGHEHTPTESSRFFFLFLIFELDQDFGLYSQLLFSFYF